MEYNKAQKAILVLTVKPAFYLAVAGVGILIENWPLTFFAILVFLIEREVFRYLSTLGEKK